MFFSRSSEKNDGKYLVYDNGVAVESSKNISFFVLLVTVFFFSW